ncbi:MULTISPECIES: calcium/sodium antiporter [Chromohalobacter]|uniref:Calcium/sodium antiporter n=2 Tax=Chromohalobacter TaxID=42054 RepID=A0A1Q8TET6_9GAMM|nr:MULTISPECIES: calcium/sodium antiporter [Chromohalobacter]MBZ5877787.1 calcium/sodium antiporter [Chromohalobacter salexigens]MDF9436072.1 calcium/sodium antiporter [Chromohalobacter israelensis]OLO12193.1 calcium/sodium antiporter [Chromohalobacter japonicus]PWW31006.1 cation:H+ antiporter [Chromohalobacter salexigens]SOC53957.1 cation:H+ antiporter [Chromohalobacter canadensis]
MLLPILAIILGIVLLLWSADRFVEGAAAVAGHLGLPSLVIGMVIVGFGTSAPEIVVSIMAALDGNPDLALGNALGSNIYNVGLIIGVTALIVPIAVHSTIIRRELPLLLLFGAVAGVLFWNGQLSRLESLLLLLGFFALMGWTIWTALRGKDDPLVAETEQELSSHAMTLGRAIVWLVVGLTLLLVSSRMLVWGAVSVASALGVSDLIIGLTIVALGTSLPELASSIAAVRKGEHDIAMGNVVGSCMFNLLAVVGIAGVIAPMEALSADIMLRDWPVMMAMVVSLFVMGYGFRGEGRINRIEASALLLGLVAYNGWLVNAVLMA